MTNIFSSATAVEVEFKAVSGDGCGICTCILLHPAGGPNNGAFVYPSIPSAQPTSHPNIQLLAKNNSPVRGVKVAVILMANWAGTAGQEFVPVFERKELFTILHREVGQSLGLSLNSNTKFQCPYPSRD